MSIDVAALREGDTLPVLELRPDVTQAVRYSALSWNFTPMFYDPEAARAQGMPGTLVPGPLKLGLLYRAVEEWLGAAGYVRQVRAAHRRPDITGRTLTITGQVARIYDEAGARRADLEMAIVNDEGQPSVRGFATVEFF